VISQTAPKPVGGPPVRGAQRFTSTAETLRSRTALRSPLRPSHAAARQGNIARSSIFSTAPTLALCNPPPAMMRLTETLRETGDRNASHSSARAALGEVGAEASSSGPNLKA